MRKSFNDIGSAIVGRISDINKGFQATNDLLDSIKNTDSIWDRLFPSKEVIQSQLIDVDILENFETAEEAMKTAENAASSALRAQEEYEKGIQYSLDRLSASFQEFSNDVLDSDLLKWIIDFGNGAINVLDAIIDELGLFGTLGAGASITAFVKNLDRQKVLKIA